MKNRFLNTSTLLVSLFALSAQSSADSFWVLDQQGLPVKNAVLEFINPIPTPKPAPQPNTLIMDQVDKLFKPDILVVQQGDFVDFPNSDNIRHHVYSFSSVNPFELKLYSGRPEAPLQFNKTGVAVLGCNIHDSMVGYIYIAGSKHVLMTDEQGKATLEDDIKYESVNVWHSSSVTSVKNIPYDNLSTKPTDTDSFVINLVLEVPEPRNTFQTIFKPNGE
ncbi:methylamine utilization protein [Colwellia polaris]|uniref:methylamine utilization protein n=1 Tax=Colwellia polaris TaxID=326537 RepID=UPI000A1712ED|nr:methylamine utilization protein [Colwellia polaris]